MHSFADKCKRTNQLPIVHLKDDTPPVEGGSAPSSCCSFFKPKSWHMKRRMRATRRRLRGAVVNAESETTGEVDPTQRVRSGSDARAARRAGGRARLEGEGGHRAEDAGP